MTKKDKQVLKRTAFLSSVFSLAGIGIACSVLVAVLRAIEGDFGYLIVLACCSPLMWIAGKAIHQLMALLRRIDEQENLGVHTSTLRL